METTEQRRHRRLPRDGRVTVQAISYPLGETPEHAVRMLDVSAGGVRFRSPVAFPEDAVLQVALTLQGWHLHTSGFWRYDETAVSKPLTAIARVVRCTPAEDGAQEVGVQFLDIWEDHWRAMRLYLEEQLAETGAVPAPESP